MTMNDKILLNRREAAALLSVSLPTLDLLIRQSFLHPKHIGKRVLFYRTELARFADQCVTA